MTIDDFGLFLPGIRVTVWLRAYTDTSIYLLPRHFTNLPLADWFLECFVGRGGTCFTQMPAWLSPPGALSVFSLFPWYCVFFVTLISLGKTTSVHDDQTV